MWIGTPSSGMTVEGKIDLDSFSIALQRSSP
jgi:hypothetical protein